MDASDKAPAEQRGKTRGMWLFCLCGAGLFMFHWLRFSPQKYLWLDEITTYYLVSRDSLEGFFSSYLCGVEKTPPLYYLLLFTLTRVFEPVPLVLRSLSAVFIAGSIPLVLLALKPRFGLGVSFLAVAAGYLSSKQVALNCLEARTYGFLFFNCALLLLAYAKCLQHERPEKSVYVLIVLANFLVPASSYPGLIYCLLTAAALAVFDLSRQKFRRRLYAAFAAGWLLFFSVHGFFLLRQMASVKALSWMPPVLPESLFEQYAGLLAVPVNFLVFLLLLLLWPEFRREGNKKPEEQHMRQMTRGWVLQAGAWLLAPLVLYDLGQAGFINLFMRRYFFPSLFGVCVFLALLLSAVLRAAAGADRLEDCAAGPGRRLLFSMLILFLGWNAFQFVTRETFPVYVANTPGLEAVRPCRLPKVTFDPFVLYPGTYYARPHETYFGLTRGESKKKRLERFSPEVKRLNYKTELNTLEKFLYIESAWDPPGFDIGKWARENGYGFEKEISCGDLYRFHVLRKEPVARPGPAPRSEPQTIKK